MSGIREIPLTPAQRAIWTIQKMDPSTDIYRGWNVVTAPGALDRGLLQRALDECIAAHDSLRISFPMAGGHPAQVVHEDRRVTIDWRTTAKRPLELESELLGEARRPYDLENGPLPRLIVFACQSGEHVIAYAHNHIVADLASSFLILEELEQRYLALTGEGPAVSPTPLQFGDIVAAQQSLLSSEAGARAEAYWRERLAGAAVALALPLDHSRPAVVARRGDTVMFEVRESVVTRLERVAAQAGASLNAALLAGVAALLHRCSGQSGLTVGTYVSGRAAASKRRVLGLTSALLPLPVEIGAAMTFTDLMTRVSRSMRAGFRHQGYPIALMAERFQLGRDPSRLSIVQVAVNLQSESPIRLQHPRWQRAPWRNMRLRNQEGQFELMVTACPDERGALACGLQYQTALFDRGTIERLAVALVTLLEGVATDPDCPVSALPLLAATERATVLTEWNRTARDYPRLQGVHELIREQIARTPDAMAVSDETGTITFRQFGDRVAALASRLRGEGAGRGSLVGICLPPSIMQVVALTAVLEAGAAYVPLDPAHPRERRMAMIEDTGVPLLIGNDSTVEGLSVERILLVDGLDGQNAIEPPPAGANSGGGADSGGEALAYVVFTSGSTGRPKGIAVPHRALVNVLIGLQDLLRIGPADTWLSITTLSFDVAALEIFLPLITGAHLVMADRDVAGSGSRLADACDRWSATIVQATPTSWRLVLGSGRWPARPITRISGGESLPRAVADGLARHPGPIWNFYGPAETTVYSTAARVTSGEGTPTIGRPIANTAIYILDSARQPVPSGVIGELWIGGDGVALGYINRPDLTAERFVPDPFRAWDGGHMYRTGDLARWLPSGELEFLGRIDHQVKIRGIRIEPEEIEAALLQQHGIAQAVVMTRLDGTGEPRLVAYVVPAAGLEIDVVTLRQRLRERLPDYMVPASFTVIDAMPLNPNRKIDRGALPDPHSEPVSRTPFAAPRDAVEAQFARLFAEVLDVERVGIDDDFFDLGGASISSLHLCDRAEACGFPLAPEAVFEHRTVRGLAALVAAAR
jgi:amino acid adenylation domain-containing protein